ncbi:MAG: hypothetical protein GY751_27130 [Bacteroidetes bacterium]|nr:hypothetical protein [Bacteroidota bacterium]
MSDSKLILEILNGPLDGHVVTLETVAVWAKEGDGFLIFPWDAELGTPQAHFILEEGNWFAEGSSSPHGTNCLNK